LTLEKKLHAMEQAAEGAARANVARELRLTTMDQVRDICDDVEEKVPADLWSLATYKQLLFLDSHHGQASIAGN